MPRRQVKKKKTGVPGIYEVTPTEFLVVRTWMDPKTGKKRKKEVTVNGRFELAVAIRRGLKDGAATERSRTKWRDFAMHFVEACVRSMAPFTQDRYLNSIGHLNLRFGDHWLDAIEALDIEDWRNDMEKEGYKPRTINGWLRVMRSMFKRAVKEKRIRHNPAREVRGLTEGRVSGRRGVSLSVAEFKALLSTVRTMKERGEVAPDIARMIETLAWTGCRIGELVALRWEDWRHGELQIARARSKHIVKLPKNGDPRSTTVVEPLAQVLQEQRQWLLSTQHAGLESGLVFPGNPQQAKAAAARYGRAMRWHRSRSCLDKPLREACQRAGVRELSPHGFRRTLENLMRKAAVEGVVRRSMSGWRSEEAQNIYEVVDPEDRADAGKALVALVEG